MISDALRFVLHFFFAAVVFALVSFVCEEYLIPWIRKVIKRVRRSD